MKLCNPTVAVIILNWNGKEDTFNCLESVQKIDFPNYEIIVVDNASSDGSVTLIKSKFPEVTVLENSHNLGYAGGNNSGISYALSKNHDYIFILNNDAIVDTSILKNFVRAAEKHPTAGIFGAKIYYLNEPQKIWFGGSRWLPNTTHFITDDLGTIDDEHKQEETRKISYACGCALFFSAEVPRKIGLLEHKYFLNWEEIDFCCRAQRSGFDCLIVLNAHVWHKISASFKGGEEGLLRQYFQTRNKLLWMERNLPISAIIKIYYKEIIPEIGTYFRTYFSSKSDLQQRIRSKVRLAAIRDYFFRRFGDCPTWIRLT